MKRGTSAKNNKNQKIWEEFVYKNSIKKKTSNSSIRISDIERREPFTIEEFIYHSKSDIKPRPAERKNYFRKSIVNLISPKIEIGIDQNKVKKIKSGKIVIEGTLDLHGFSFKEAENMLRLFIGDSLRLKKRLLLVITGKGLNSKPNIYGKTLTIKSEIKNWLSDSFYSDKIQYISEALGRHGGEGAYYFFLKKSKNIFS